jgi:co-chaperonin GroES (HSP10)
MEELKIKKIKPLFNAVVTTMDKYTEDIVSTSGIISSTSMKGSLKPIQKVIAVGTMVRDIVEGDLVQINPRNYAVRKHKEGSLKDGVIEDNVVTGYRFNTIELDDVEYLYLTDRDIDYVITDYEILNTESTLSNLYVPNKDIIS